LLPGCWLKLVVVPHLDLDFNVVIDLLGVEVKERKTFAFELLGERDSPEERMFAQPGFGLRRWFRIERLRMRPG
jgi:hypothetical protein